MQEAMSRIIFIIILLIPFLLTGWNIIISIRYLVRKKESRLNKWVEIVAIGIGCIYLFFYWGLSDILFVSWEEQLYNAQKHSMIAPEHSLTIAVLFVLSLICYLIIRFWPSRKQPPLLSVIGIAGMYLGIGVSLLFCIQTSGIRVDSPGAVDFFDAVFFALVPANYILIIYKTIYKLVWEKKEQLSENKLPEKMHKLSRLLEKSSNLPLLGLIAMIPLLGLVIVVLLLFGQAPDSVIKAWTDTADWTLSQRIAPVNLTYDEHYLCTIAAGGHPELVKPLRPGLRHGHSVIVNRQLCIANAFEQVLEEKVPRFHKIVRGMYDRIGYPISRKIRSKYIADVIYILMKPLEWFFLLILYSVDVKPENRIAVQYPHKPLPEHPNKEDKQIKIN